jgi:hypothetical protein
MERMVSDNGFRWLLLCWHTWYLVPGMSFEPWVAHRFLMLKNNSVVGGQERVLPCIFSAHHYLLGMYEGYIRTISASGGIPAAAVCQAVRPPALGCAVNSYKQYRYLVYTKNTKYLVQTGCGKESFCNLVCAVSYSWYGTVKYIVYLPGRLPMITNRTVV